MRVLGKPIDVVAWFTKEGLPRPIRFRITNEEESETVMSVDKVVFSSREKLAGNHMLVFRCQGKLNGVERIYELKYELLTCKWILFKM